MISQQSSAGKTSPTFWYGTIINCRKNPTRLRVGESELEFTYDILKERKRRNQMLREFFHYSEKGSLQLHYPIPGFDSASKGTKPEGFWLADESAGPSWREYCLENEFRLESLGFRYRALVRMDRIMVLSNPHEIRDFNDKWIMEDGLVAWDEVARSACGLLVSPYMDEVAARFAWLASWSVPSLCLWKTDEVISLIKI